MRFLHFTIDYCQRFFFLDLTVCLSLDLLSVVSFCSNPAFAYPIVRREFILESWLMIQLTLRDLSLYVLQLDILCEYRSIYSQVLVASFLTGCLQKFFYPLETLKACNIQKRIRDTSGYKEYILLFNSYISTLKFGLFLLVLDVFFICK